MNVVEEHRASSPVQLRVAVITVSDTRTLANDIGGQTIVDLLATTHYELAAREIVRDEPAMQESLIKRLLGDERLDALLLTGGTGLGSRDQTCDTIGRLLTRVLPGYGELFRMLSYEQVGAAAMLSRAVGGLIGRVVVLTMPGSPAGVQLAMEKLILPELAHLVREARR